jgi:hypothetical protein
VPVGNRVIVANPHFFNPLIDATEIEVTGRDTGRIALAAGYASHGQTVRRTRNKAGTVTDVWLAGSRLIPEKNPGGGAGAQICDAPTPPEPLTLFALIYPGGWLSRQAPVRSYRRRLIDETC